MTCRIYLFKKIAICCHDLLDPGPEVAAGLHHVDLGDVGKHFRDARHQSLLSVVRGSIGISLSHAPHIVIQEVAVRRVGRPYLLLKEERDVLPAPLSCAQARHPAARCRAS